MIVPSTDIPEVALYLISYMIMVIQCISKLLVVSVSTGTEISHGTLLSRLTPGSDDELFHKLHIELMLTGCDFSDKHEINPLLLLKTTATNQHPSKLFKPAANHAHLTCHSKEDAQLKKPFTDVHRCVH